METTGRDVRGGYELQSVNQALDLVDALIAAREGLTLSHLSRTFTLSKNKTFRILATLEQRGMVEKDCQGLYRLGISAFGTAHRILASKSILDHARPILAELATALNEAVYLATVVGREAMFLEMVDCCQPVKTKSFIGSRFPFPNSTDAGNNATEFDVAGITLNVNNITEEATIVSATLLDSSEKVAGALVVLAPAFRMSMERITSEMLLPISAAAKQLSQKLGIKSGHVVQARIQPQTLGFPVKRPAIAAAASSDHQKIGRQCHH